MVTHKGQAQVDPEGASEVTADKAYHSNDVLRDLEWLACAARVPSRGGSGDGGRGGRPGSGGLRRPVADPGARGKRFQAPRELEAEAEFHASVRPRRLARLTVRGCGNRHRKVLFGASRVADDTPSQLSRS